MIHRSRHHDRAAGLDPIDRRYDVARSILLAFAARVDDVGNAGHRDASIRPNKILAVSLCHSPLPLDKARSAVDTVERHLLTQYGLRTLAPTDPLYRGQYEGTPYHRDSASHQGTVWPWLLGPYIRAAIRVNGRTPETHACVSELLRYLHSEGVGQIAEVFDGDAPHRAGGCIAQAWSVAELLRVVAEDIHVAQDRNRCLALPLCVALHFIEESAGFAAVTIWSRRYRVTFTTAPLGP